MNGNVLSQPFWKNRDLTGREGGEKTGVKLGLLALVD